MNRPIVIALLTCSFALPSGHALAVEQSAVSRAPADADKATAPTQPARSARFRLGLTLHRFQDDFGFGACASPPEFAHLLLITLGGGLAFVPNVPDGDRESWVPYGNARTVVEIGRRVASAPIRLYAFGGPQGVFVSSRLRDDPVGI